MCFFELGSNHVSLELGEEGNQLDFAWQVAPPQLLAESVAAKKHVEQSRVDGGEELTFFRGDTHESGEDEGQVEVDHDEVPDIVGQAVDRSSLPASLRLRALWNSDKGLASRVLTRHVFRAPPLVVEAAASERAKGRQPPLIQLHCV